MHTRKIVNEILDDAANQRTPKPYKEVYFIKVLNPGDRKTIFVSFRWKSSKLEVFVCRVQIDLENTDKNVTVAISFLLPRKRESVTFFRKNSLILNQPIADIMKNHAGPLLADKLKLVEDYYVSN